MFIAKIEFGIYGAIFAKVSLLPLILLHIFGKIKGLGSETERIQEHEISN